ncbi:MAG TPA: lysophospholipid acyltransferase family protein [Rhizomicrobium sp.]|nr:lysophospholipid acyltransferase family protein [Rhizomicrobium sp.]
MILFRSILFLLWFVPVTIVIFIAALPTLVLPRGAAVYASRTWSRAIVWGLKHLANLDFELRGQPPTTGVLIASKHMSFWDSIALYLVLDGPEAVVKRELTRIPFYGWYIRKAGVIAIDRGGHASALRKMAAEARAAMARGHAVMIFPEGTRKDPGAAPDYKPGVAALYGQLDVACVPVALNSGLFWTGPLGVIKKPGKIVMEFLEPVPPGLKRPEFMATLQDRIESATAKLVAEGREILAREGAL